MYNEVKEEHTCSICLGVFYKPILLKKCSHIFCEMCIDDASLEMDNKKCPLCRTKFKSQDIVPHQKLEEEIVSAYPDELKEKLKSMREIKKYRLEIGNTTAFLSGPVNNKYQWTFFVRPAEGEKPLSNFADRVEIDLHPTFNPPTLMIPASEPIQVRRTGWGTFRIEVKIHWSKKYGGFTELYHDLRFVEKTSKVEVCRLEPKVKPK